jgi:hypothetical protein
LDAWQVYDPKATKFMACEDLPKFLTDLKPPLGLGKISPAVAEQLVQKLDIPVTADDRVYFPDVLLALAERLYDIVSQIWPSIE